MCRAARPIDPALVSTLLLPILPPPGSTLFPYTTLFRSPREHRARRRRPEREGAHHTAQAGGVGRVTPRRIPARSRSVSEDQDEARPAGAAPRPKSGDDRG